MNSRGKNLRLSYNAWQQLRKLKFKLGAESYSDVLEKVFAYYSGSDVLSDDVRSKVPSDQGDLKAQLANKNHGDKTIVVSPKIHEKLLEVKNEYMLEKGYTSRGPNAVSVSDILIDLLKSYQLSMESR